MIGPQQARQAEHGLADHRQVLGGFVEGDALTCEDLATNAPDQNTQQGNLVRKDDFFCGFKAPTFCEGEVFGVRALVFPAWPPRFLRPFVFVSVDSLNCAVMVKVPP